MKKLIALAVVISIAFNYQEEKVSPTGLKEGDKAPLFDVKDQNGQKVNLSSFLKEGDVVLFFYRGAWCPFCNKQMSELQDSIQFILDKGASIIAVTPETTNSIDKTIEKTEASFSIIQDKGYEIMNDYKVLFKVDDATVKKYELYGIDLEKANGNNENLLPVPATYVIGQNGTIKYVYFDTDYKKRATVKEILSALGE